LTQVRFRPADRPLGARGRLGPGAPSHLAVATPVAGDIGLRL